MVRSGLLALLLLAACGDDVLLGENLGAPLAPPPGAPWSVLEAEAARGVSAPAVQSSPLSSGGAHLSGIMSGDAVTLDGLELGAGSNAIQLRVATPRTDVRVEIREGSRTGRLLAELALPSTGGWSFHQNIPWSHKWRVITARIAEPRGAAALVLVWNAPVAGRVADLDFVRLLGPTRPTTYLVAPDGDDRASGRGRVPLRTISAGISRLRPGDTLLIRPGAYRERVVVPPTVSGTPDAPITVRGAGEGTEVTEVTIDGTGLSAEPFAALWDAHADHAVYEGLSIAHVAWSDGRGFSSDGDHVRVLNLRVRDVNETGVLFVDTVGIEARGLEITDTGRKNLAPSARAAGGWPGALSVVQSSDALLLDNRVVANHGDGIKLIKDVARVRMARNVVRDSWSTNIYLDNAHDCIVEQNLSYSTATAYIPSDSPDAGLIPNAFAVGDDDYARFSPLWRCDAPEVMRPGGGNVFRNNIAVNTRVGFTFARAFIPCSGLKNTTVVNNTIAAQWDHAVYVAPSMVVGEHRGSVFLNNVLHVRNGGRDGAVVSVGARADTRLELNLLFGARDPNRAVLWSAADLGATNPMPVSALGPGDNARDNRWADPGLVSIASVEGDVAAAHRLRADSPAIDRAERAVDVDHFGRPRPIGPGPDIGAHEWAADDR